ncbi:MAG: PSD1 and planctomycete cytochrome C domain-containing protein [Planctomycetota bacterium]
MTQLPIRNGMVAMFCLIVFHGLSAAALSQLPKDTSGAGQVADSDIALKSTLVEETPISSEERQARIDFFETKIRPVLVEHCYECHSGQAKIVQANLRLDSRASVSRGGDSGPALVPFQPQPSLILQSLRYEGVEMPPSGKLDASIANDFERWIREGAMDPREDDASPNTKPWLDPATIESHWAFRSPVQLPVPNVDPPQAAGSELHPIDRWVEQSLRAKGWKPAPLAGPLTLLRRATLDLTGIPPTPEEIAVYLAEEPSDRYERLVDRLLASPEYGVRWGRHWLDCVRYADTNGADENHDMPNAWRYRDWVVDVLNEDLPFDQFVTQQIAGDLLPAPASEREQGRLLTATGFWVLGPKMLAEQDKAKMRIDIVDEQIDTFSRTMLGVTLSCARCHDHKFDPFTQQDYYALAGVLMSTRAMADEAFVSKWMERPLPSAAKEEERRLHQQKIDAARQRSKELTTQANQQLLNEGKLEKLPEDPAAANPNGLPYPPEIQKDLDAIKSEIEALVKGMPTFDHAMAVEENPPVDIPVHLRGNHLKPGDQTIPRGVPDILTRAVPLPSIDPKQSGRLQVAQWLVHPDHPLLARVMVNRIWMWHMGQPLVASPSNFGLRGESPSHPELLDWLSREWIQNGWSMKWLHRQILLSAAYRRSSRAAEYHDQDPENRWLWKQNTRRMELEPLRDSILQVSGKLDSRLRGSAQGIGSRKRSIYLSINRAALADMFSVFDYVDPASHIEQRPVTTVPSQALFLLNSDLVIESADALAEWLHRQSLEPTACIELAYVKILSRPPNDWERERAQLLLKQAYETILSEQTPAPPAASDSVNEPARIQAIAVLVRSLIASREFSWVE